MKDMYDLISKQYLDKTFLSISSKKDILLFKNNLIKKWQKFLGKNNNKLNKTECEKIYYFLKMMYWGGSRITYFNRYGYRFHPLLDYELIYKLFYIGDDKKADHKFMMKTIEKFDKSIASHKSNYGYNFIWDENKRSSYKNLRKISLYKKSILNNLNKKYIKFTQKEVSWRKFLEKDMIIKKYIGDKIDNIDPENKKLGRIFTIEYFLEKYNNKILT
jgi:succinate dehydrogenase flavin-adding protein (antitoxin of CptAB toxin-antitoxin module)